ncbi:uncharacterized protein LOC124418933 [Lucilia cuprina]|uniref:uncharacterized protein LOC124418933 n=1 Tax=Lucilia cuprina TaxID=7375 RepID=UPI001F050F20|nr:uncharacterized protein LOC124418933 [Lucilia cuprina]
MAPQKSADQCKIFLQFMEKHPGLAKGFLKGDKVKQEQLWIDLANQLNACGPPSRDVANWKKTWCDWRRSIKTRLAENKSSLKKTGGGQFQQHFVSPVEEQLAIICGIFQTVDGVAMAKTFATQSKETYFKSDVIIESESSAMVPNCENTIDLENLEYSPSPATPEISPQKKRKRFDGDIQNLMGEEKKILNMSLQK